MQEFLVSYGLLFVAGIFIWYLIIAYGTRADRQVKNQEAIFDILEKIAKKHGVTDDEIQGIKNYRRMK